MKKKLKNNDIQRIYACLQMIGNRKGNMNDRWNLALKSEPFLRKQELLSMKCQELVESEGTVDEKTGTKSILQTNEKYLSLLDCETEVEYDPILLSEINEAGIDELLALKEVVNNDQTN